MGLESTDCDEQCSRWLAFNKLWTWLQDGWDSFGKRFAINRGGIVMPGSDKSRDR